MGKAIKDYQGHGQNRGKKIFQRNSVTTLHPKSFLYFFKKDSWTKKKVQKSIPFGLGNPLNEIIFLFFLKMVVIGILSINFNDGG